MYSKKETHLLMILSNQSVATCKQRYTALPSRTSQHILPGTELSVSLFVVLFRCKLPYFRYLHCCNPRHYPLGVTCEYFGGILYPRHWIQDASKSAMTVTPIAPCHGNGIHIYQDGLS